MKNYLILLLLLLLSISLFGENKMNWHYRCNFGMHYDLHPQATDTELGAKITHENLRKALKKINPDWIQCDCKGHAGYTAWPTKYGTLSPGYIKDAMRIHSDVCHELGIKLGVHYSGVIDVVACEKHPEWEAKAPKGPDGKAQGYSSVHKSVCPHSAYYDELLIPQFMELIDNYDIDGFWVDGDCWGVLPCYCDKCTGEFKEKYGIDAPTDKSKPEYKLWNEYHRQLFINNVNKYTEAVHKKKPDCLVISNWMLTFGAPVEDTLITDYISGDLSYDQGLKSAVLEGHFIPNRGRDWDLMAWGFGGNTLGEWEVKSIPYLKQECAYVTACGGAAMIYGKPNRNGLLPDWHNKIYGEISKFIKERAEVSRHSVSVPQIAVIHNPTDYFDGTIDGVYTINLLHPAMIKFIGCCNLLSENHYHYDLLMTNMLKGKLSNYKLVIIPEVYKFDDEFKNELRDYVQNGGNVLIGGSNATCAFGDILGIKGNEFGHTMTFVQVGNEVTNFGKLDHFKAKLNGAKALKYIMKEGCIGDSETDRIATVINEFGKGKAVGITFNMFTSYGDNHFPRMRMLFKELMDLYDVEYKISQVEAPSYVHFNLREKDNKIIVNLNNVGKISNAAEVKKNDIFEEIPEVYNIKFRLKLDKKPNKVFLIPSKDNIKSTYKDGYLYVTVKKLEIMETIVIE